MTERRIGIKDIPQAMFGKVTGELILASTEINIIDQNNSVNLAREGLKNNSLIVAFSHTDGDYKVIGKFIKKLTHYPNTATLVAQQYLDPSRGVGSWFKATMMHSWEKGLGVKIIPTVQDYDKANYTNADSINYQSTKDTLRFIKEPGHVLSVAPTGHRDTLGLSRAVEGVGGILKKINPNTLILPLGVIPSSIRPGKPTDVFVGKLLTAGELEAKRALIFASIQNKGLTPSDLKHQQNQQLADTLMLEIAKLLPLENRGVYKNQS